MDLKDDRRRRVEDEVAKTLESMAALEHVTASPQFFARIQARLRRAEEVRQPWLVRQLLAGKLAPAVLAVVILLNVITAVVMVRSREATSSFVRESNVATVASQYLSGGGSVTPDILGE